MRKTFIAIAAAALLASTSAWAKELPDAEWHLKFDTRRFTRLTNGFSKKVENHAHSVALFAMYGSVSV